MINLVKRIRAEFGNSIDLSRYNVREFILSQPEYNGLPYDVFCRSLDRVYAMDGIEVMVRIVCDLANMEIRDYEYQK